MGMHLQLKTCFGLHINVQKSHQIVEKNVRGLRRQIPNIKEQFPQHVHQFVL